VFELLGLLAVVVMAGVAVFLVALLVLPLLLLFQVVGWGAHVAAQGVGLLVGVIVLLLLGVLLIPLGLIMRPVVAVIGGLVLLTLAILAAPLLLLAVLIWAVVALTRRPVAV